MLGQRRSEKNARRREKMALWEVKRRRRRVTSLQKRLEVEEDGLEFAQLRVEGARSDVEFTEGQSATRLQDTLAVALQMDVICARFDRRSDEQRDARAKRVNSIRRRLRLS